MKKLLLSILAVISLGSIIAWGANYTVTQGAGTTFGSLVVSTVNYAQMLMCDPTTPSQCAAVDASGIQTVKGTVTAAQATAANLNATVVQGTAANLNAQVAQPTAASLNATVVGTGTFAVQAAQSGTWTVQPGNTANTTPWLVTCSNCTGAGGASNVTISNILVNAAVDGWNITAGAKADAACGTDNGTCSELALIKRTNQNLTTINTSVNSPIPTGTNTIGSVTTISQYPTAAVPYTASATGTTAATTATLAGAASVTTYICGFSIRANATAAATGNATVTGTISGTLNFTQWTAPLATGLGVAEMIFTPCVPASAANTSIAVVSAAPGAGGVVSVTAWGYKL